MYIYIDISLQHASVYGICIYIYIYIYIYIRTQETSLSSLDGNISKWFRLPRFGQWFLQVSLKLCHLPLHCRKISKAEL